MACVRAGDAGRPLGRTRVPPRCGAERAPSRGDDGHAYLHRHPGGVGLVGGSAPLSRRRTHVLRGRCRDHDPDPRRPLSRSSRQATVGCCDPRAARSRRQGGSRAARRQRGRRCDRGRAAWRPSGRAARGEDSHRRNGRRRRLCRRSVDADRRARSGRRGAGVRRRWRDHQHLRPPRRSRNEGRRGDRARADRAPRRRSPVREGAYPAACRPCLGRLRPDRARARARDTGRLDPRDRRRHRCLLRRGGRADHRLPVRARSRDADRAHGRHRPRSPARHSPSRAPRPSSARAGSRRSCSTRQGRSPREGWS